MKEAPTHYLPQFNGWYTSCGRKSRLCAGWTYRVEWVTCKRCLAALRRTTPIERDKGSNVP